jgi:CHASE2 domain-containing sensor protein
VPTDGKLVVLKFNGDLQQGLQVMLEIGNDGARPSTELVGALPPNPELAQHLLQWQQIYRSLNSDTLSINSRIDPRQIVYGGSVNRIKDCRRSALQLQQQMTHWLESFSFLRLDRRLREALNKNESIRVLIRTQDPQLRRLPWHLWDFIDRYSKSETGLSSTLSEQVEIESQVASNNCSKVKVLAILGNSQNINVQADSQFLQALPNAEVTFLVEPSRQQIDEQLWEQKWHILFFAGHSTTEGDRGFIYINPHERITLEELKYGLRRAIAQGLQIAIFNSCDGLGLAQALETLPIPQMIVMREPVPDLVAQEFLKHFLSAYSGDKSFYLSVREAKERLHCMEDRFPCASWLPTIVQNSAEIPPSYQELVNSSQLLGEDADLDIHEIPLSTNTPRVTNATSDRQWQIVLNLQRLLRRMRQGWLAIVVSLVMTIGLIGIHPLALLQSWELNVYDLMMQHRPDEGMDSRLLIVEVTDEDIKAQKQKGESLQRQSLSAQSLHQEVETSLSDRSLERLLNVLGQHQPRVIGLDIYRDFSVDSDRPELANRLRHTPGLITVCKAEDFDDPNIPSINPPPEVPLNRVGFSDFREDSDGILRRHLLGMLPLLRTPDSRCNVDRAFGVAIAAQYLQQQNIKIQFTDNGDLQLGDRIIKILRSHHSAYPLLESGGSEILLNYRSTTKIADSVTLGEIFKNNINPSSVKDKIVLVGVTAKGGEDMWYVPTNPHVATPGVIVQAHIISQLLSATLDGRSILTILSQWQALGWVWTWAMVGCFLAFWRWQRKNKRRVLLHLAASMTVAIVSLYGLCFFSLLRGKWLPFVSPVLALILSSTVVVIYLIYRSLTRSAPSS